MWYKCGVAYFCVILNKKGLVYKMKRLLAIAMSVSMMAAMLTGCGSSDETNLSNTKLEKYVTALPEYKGIELSATKTEVTDEYVDSYIDYILSQYPVYEEVTGRAVENGDIANIDYEGKKDGVAFEGGTAQGYDLAIGSGTFIEGFEEGLIGVNVGETVDLNLTFPEDYAKTELAGQAVVFTVTVNSISISKPAELNDEFVAQFGNTSVEEFRNSAIISLEDSAEATYMTELQNQAIDILTEGCEFTDGLPEGLYAYYQQQIKANFENYAAAYGVDLNTFISQAYGTTEEEFNLQIEEGAAKSTRQAMACALIAQKEGITVTDEEVEADLAENYAKLGYESPEAYKENASIEDYRDYLLTNKVIEFIIDNAVITEAPVETTEAEVVAE